MNVDNKLIKEIATEWKDQEVQDIVEAMKVSLKNDLRKGEHKYNFSNEIVEALIEEVPNEEFWKKLHLLLNYFGFDF